MSTLTRRRLPLQPQRARLAVLVGLLALIASVGLALPHGSTVSGADAPAAFAHDGAETVHAPAVHALAATATEGAAPEVAMPDSGCEACGEGGHEGAVLTCAMLAIVAIVLLVPALRRHASVIGIVVAPRSVSVPAAPPTPRAPDLHALGVSRT